MSQKTIENWVWLIGWGIDINEISQVAKHYIPKVNHHCIAPTSTWGEQLESLNADHYLAYSLGAFLLIHESPKYIWERKCTWLAPFSNFKTQGNQIESKQIIRLKYLIRQLKTDPLNTITEFHKQSGINHAPLKSLPYSQKELIWGIEQLLENSKDLLLPKKNTFIGANDKLIHAKKLQLNNPNLTIIPEGTHSLNTLLAFIYGS